MQFDAMKMTKSAQTKQDRARALEVAKTAATRVNTDGGTKALFHKSDRAHPDVKRNSQFEKRERPHNEALPRETNIWTSEFYDGAELRPFDGRVGAMDFKKCPSKGIG